MGVSDEVADFRLRVIHAFGAHASQFGELLALDAEALVVRQVPVQNVHLHGSHPVEVALENVERDEVAADVNQQAAPGKTGLVFNSDGGSGESGGRYGDQLKKGLQATNGTQHSGCCELRARIS